VLKAFIAEDQQRRHAQHHMAPRVQQRVHTLVQRTVEPINNSSKCTHTPVSVYGLHWWFFTYCHICSHPLRMDRGGRLESSILTLRLRFRMPLRTWCSKRHSPIEWRR
jgi:hypothetical protein